MAAWLRDPNDQWRSYLQDGEHIAVYGYLTWLEKEIEQRGKGLCMVAATDRRFMMLPFNYSRAMSSIPYALLGGRYRLHKRLFTWYLTFDTDPAANFTGPTGLLRHFDQCIGQCISAGIPSLDKTTVSFKSYQLDVIPEQFLACDSCKKRVTHVSRFCDSCSRIIDWKASGNARSAYIEAMKKIGYL